MAHSAPTKHDDAPPPASPIVTSFLASQDEKEVMYADFNSADPSRHRELSRKLMRKVDWNLLPFLGLMYLLNTLDRVYVPFRDVVLRYTDQMFVRRNLAQAYQGTLSEDLHLAGEQFNVITSVLFVVCHA